MKIKRKFAAAMAVAVAVLMSNASAATVYTGNIESDLWTKSLYTDQNRIYGSGTYRTNYEWPGTSTLRNSGYPNCILEPGSMSIDEVFGSKCSDLLYTDPAETKDPVTYMKDGDRLLNNYGMYEWNGFLFVLTGGYKVKLTERSVTDENGAAQTYEVAYRNDTSGYDSYLYVFDISRGEHYDKSCYAKWSASDFGLQSDTSYQFMEGIAVDDNCIYILTNNGASSSDKYARGAIVLKNTVKRGAEATVPTRVDISDAEYKHGVKELVSSSMTSGNAYQTFECNVAGRSLICWSSNELSLSAPASKAAAGGIWVTPMGETIGDTKVYYSADTYLGETDSASLSLAGLLRCSAASSWSGVESPMIRDIYADGNEITFLVTYSLNGTYYKQIFVTDWSDPSTPVLLADIAYKDTDAQAAETPSFTGRIYSYEGYIYVSSVYGVETIKKYDDKNNIALAYNSKLDLSEAGQEGYVLRLGVCGDYLYGWVNINQNSEKEIKAKLSSDKTAVEKCVGKGSAVRRTENVIAYGGRIYTQWANSQIGDAARQSCVFVADTNKMMPVSLSVDKIEDTVMVPYTITGYGQNIEAVSVTVNGQDMGYIKTEDDGSGLDKWKYTVSSPGNYEIIFKGASMEGYISEGTSETVDFTAYSRSNVTMTSSYKAVNDTAVVTISVTNSNQIPIAFIPIAALYSDDAMENVAFGEKTEIAAGLSAQITINLTVPQSAVEYKIKTFIVDGLDTIAPITEAAEN